jgi:hypothetical protein
MELKMQTTSLGNPGKPVMEINWCGQPYNPLTESYYGDVKKEEQRVMQRTAMAYARNCLKAQRLAKKVDKSKPIESDSQSDALS